MTKLANFIFINFKSSMNSINFTANFIKYVPIKKREDDKYKPYVASLIKIDKSNNEDINALKEISKNWGESFAQIVNDDAIKNKQNDNIHIYALTTQKSKYKNLNHKKILGLLEYNDNFEDGGKIEILQTKPDDISTNNENPEFKRIGKMLTKSIIDFYRKQKIIVRSTDEANGFYENLGFKKIENPIYKNEYIINNKET